jgi:hypothetical protein
MNDRVGGAVSPELAGQVNVRRSHWVLAVRAVVAVSLGVVSCLYDSLASDMSWPGLLRSPSNRYLDA